MVCEDQELVQLDRKLDEVYTAAKDKTTPAQSVDLRANQRGWIKGRDECWKAVDPRLCVATEYRLRITELEAQYRLLEGIGPIQYRCAGNYDQPLRVRFYETDPLSAWAEFGTDSAILYRQAAGSGAKYEGRNISLWEYHGEAVLVWGYRAPHLHCIVEQSKNRSE